MNLSNRFLVSSNSSSFVILFLEFKDEKKIYDVLRF